MNKEELKRILELHKLYISTDGQEGESICLECHHDISGFDLRGADLEGALFYDVNLQGVDFTGADLYGVVMEGCNLSGVNLRDTHLRCATLGGCNLIGAKFSIEIRECFSFEGSSVSKDQLPWLALHPRFAELLPSLQIK